MKTPPHSPDTRLPLRVLGFYAAALLALFLMFALFAHLLRLGNASPLPAIPDDQAAARQLLEHKLSGPGYFEIGEPSASLPHPYITPSQAASQLDRVVLARHFTASQREKLEALIRTLTEPSPSRMVGTERINALRLNLALEQL